MNDRFVIFEGVSYVYETMSSPLLETVTASFPEGWTGVVGANGSGKTTILKLATGLLSPCKGRVQRPVDGLYCAQRVDELPELLGPFIQSEDHAACIWKGRLAIGADWARRWDSLSDGEKKRAQIGLALWLRPAVLALDEPTNHIDADARSILANALRSFDGIGLLVSHDRELLDSLCTRCLFLDPPRAVTRPGNYSAGRVQSSLEEDSARRRREEAKRDVARLRAEERHRAAQAQAAGGRHSKGTLAPGDRDGRARIDLARLTGKDGKAAKLARQMRARVELARRNEQNILVRKSYELGIWFEGERCRRDTLFRLSAGNLPLGHGRGLSYPDLSMIPHDRIGLTGANGSGKSTLVRHLLTRVDLSEERLTYVPQEINARSSRVILEEARRLPAEELGRLMTVVSRLGSRPARLLESAEPSPGELRKLLLGIGIARQPHLIIMDEPTNHLDLPSIECLEDALEECPCGLLLVSHDIRFLDRLTRTRWHISPAPGGCRLEKVEIAV